MNVQEATDFFRDPRAKIMVNILHDFRYIKGHDLCEKMGIRYGDDVLSSHNALVVFHAVRAHVSNCLYYFDSRICSDGRKLNSTYWLERL